MGAIYKFSLQGLIDSHSLESYVETGTGEGTCLDHALKFPFKRFTSIEIFPEIYQKAKDKFIGVELLLGNSTEKLEEILPSINTNTLFFLDAHFPGADFHYTTYDNCGGQEVALPLEKELDLLVKHRQGFNDVIIIDDLRIYMDGPFEGGNWSLRDTAGSKKCGFIFDKLNQLKKQILIDYRDQGYVIAY